MNEHATPAYLTPDEDKPAIVREWLSGAITSEEAILIAMCGDDPRAKVWALHLFGSMTVKPESFVRINQCLT